MAWVNITIEDLNDTKAASLVQACREAALAQGQDDPTNEIIGDCIARIRAEIAACQKNKLDADPTKIPQDLKRLACRMIIRAMQSRLQYPLTDDEREEQRNDIRILERIARCELAISTPDNPISASDEMQINKPLPSFYVKKRVFTREDEEGL